jgi:short-subunit dehydrogenase
MARDLALVTGASGGIGLEIARLLAERGYDLVLVARDEKRLTALAIELREKTKVQATVLAKDLAQTGAAEEIFAEVSRANQMPNILVNNAGFGDFGPFGQASLERISGMIQVNVTALTQLTRLFLPSMIAQKKGRILNVASTAAFQPGPLMAVYYATKAFVLSFSEAIGNEVKDHGITVTALCPGPTQSGFQAAAKMEGSRLLRIKSMMMDARTVAALGVRGMMCGKPVVITGVANKLLAFSVRLTPRTMVTRLTRRIQEKTH